MAPCLGGAVRGPRGQAIAQVSHITGLWWTDDSPGVSSFAAVPIKVVSQVFNLPSGVQALSFTTSRFGLAAKDLICA